jgi:hypothetical protein
MRFRPGLLIEPILALAAGFGLVYAVVADPIPRPVFIDILSVRLGYLVEPFLTGLALVGGLGVALEALRRRSPRGWGWGRWAWSVAGLYLAFEAAATAAQRAARPLLGRGKMPSRAEFAHAVLLSWDFAFTKTVGLLLVALWASARLTRRRDEETPDAREWAGRVFAVAAVTWTIFLRLLIAAGN